MNGKMKALLIVSLAFNFAVLAAFTVGWINRSRARDSMPIHHRPLDQIHHRCRRLADRISLPEEKTEQLDRIMRGEDEEHRLVEQRLHEARRELFEMVWAEEPDRARLTEKAGEIAVLQGDMERLFIERLLEARSILDPEEEKRLYDHMKARMDRRMRDESDIHRRPHRDGGRR